jgi:type IV pilus assembly protein PilM
MSFFGPKKYLGVDIGTSQLKIVELEEVQKQGQLVTYGSIELASDIVRSSSNEDQVLISSALQEIMERTSATAKQAVTALPGFLVFTSVIDLPPMPEAEVNAAVKWEAKRYIPAPLEDLVLDWKVLGQPHLEQGSKETGGLQILLTAAPKNLVKRYLEIFRMADLELVGMETEVFSLTRALVGNDRTPTMVIDMGATATDINVIDNGAPILSRSVDTGGNAMTRAIANSLNVETARAEQFKRDFGMTESAQSGGIPQAIKPVINAIVEEIRHSFDLYRNKYGQDIQKIILSGGASRLPGLVNYLATQFDAFIALGDPWARVAVDPTLRPALVQAGGGYGVAVGLALKEIWEPAAEKR